LIEYDNSILLLLQMKAGEGNPQAREEEGKCLLGLERSSSPAGIPGIWELEFRGKAASIQNSMGKPPLSHSLHKLALSEEEDNNNDSKVGGGGGMTVHAKDWYSGPGFLF